MEDFTDSNVSSWRLKKKLCASTKYNHGYTMFGNGHQCFLKMDADPKTEERKLDTLMTFIVIEERLLNFFSDKSTQFVNMLWHWR